MVHFLLLLLVCRSVVEQWEKKRPDIFCEILGCLKITGSWNSMVYERLPTSLCSISSPIFTLNNQLRDLHFFIPHPSAVLQPLPTNRRERMDALNIRSKPALGPLMESLWKPVAFPQIWPAKLNSTLMNLGGDQPLNLWTWNHVGTRWQNPRFNIK